MWNPHSGLSFSINYVSALGNIITYLNLHFFMCRITALDYVISNAPAYFYDSMILLLNTGHLAIQGMYCLGPRSTRSKL